VKFPYLFVAIVNCSNPGTRMREFDIQPQEIVLAYYLLIPKIVNCAILFDFAGLPILQESYEARCQIGFFVHCVTIKK
jgi:hypothetical protein